MKKRIIIFVGILVLMIILFAYFMYKDTLRSDKSKIKDDTNYKVYQDINKRIGDKESLLVYFTNKDPYKCSECENIDKVINFYEELYNIKFIRFDSDYEKVINIMEKEYYFDRNYITDPAVMIFKDGEIKGVVNEIMAEKDLLDFLIKYGFVDKKYLDIDNSLDTDEKFSSIFNSSNNEVIVSYSGNYFNLKKELYKISLRNNLKINYVIYGNATYYKYSMILNSQIPVEHSGGTLIIVVNSGKVIDYMEYKDGSNIEEFLKKNKIIS